MWRVPSLAGFTVRAAAGAVAVSLLSAGQVLASPMSPDASVGPVSTAQPAAAALPGATAQRHPIRVG